MNVEELIRRMESWGEEQALSTPSGECTYLELTTRIRSWQERLQSEGVPAGSVVCLEGDYGTETIAASFALWSKNTIVVPLAPDSSPQHDHFRETASAEYRLVVNHDTTIFKQTGSEATHELYQKLRALNHPGLVLFTSGSSGPSKAAVQDVAMLLKKFKHPRQRLRTIVFLQMDHIGGINTLLYTFSNGGTVIVARKRTPRDVCEVIEKQRVELLPTSPTFLNLLLLSGELERRDLSSLKLITYGTEPMPETTLQRLHEKLPNVRLQQTYGMTELGILRSKSRSSSSLWMRIGGDGYETKIIEDRLWVKAASAMLGYLNAPSPFDEEGFLDTGDRVTVDGEWVRILGRYDETINVGGSKVFPSEVESALLQLDGVVDVVVRGESHPITGQIVSAEVSLSSPESLVDFKVRARRHCAASLPSYAVPSRFRLTKDSLHNARFKRIR